MRELLDNLENHLQNLEQKIKILILVSIPVAFGGIFYLFYFVDAYENIQQQNSTITKLKRDIVKNSPKRALQKVLIQKRKLLASKSELNKSNLHLLALASEVEKNRFLLTSSKDFNKFLENLLEESIANRISIDTLEITDQDKEFIGKLQTIKAIDITGNGNFLNVLRFLRKIEKNKILMMANEINIETNGTIPFVRLHIDFYGVK